MPPNLVTSTDFTPRPFEALQRSFGAKVAMTSRDFDLLKAESRARAFRMAGINKASLIQSAQNEIRKALRDGTSYRDLQNKLLNIFGREGVDALPLNHLRTIMRQNMLGAYAVQRKRFLERPAVAKAFPFWQYLTVADRNVRPEHAALHEKIFRADDPVWGRIYPPWDWGCRCTVRALDADEVDERGGEGKVVENGQQALEDNDITVPIEFDFDRDQLFERAILLKIDADLREAVERTLAKADATFQAETRAAIVPVKDSIEME